MATAMATMCALLLLPASTHASTQARCTVTKQSELSNNFSIAMLQLQRSDNRTADAQAAVDIFVQSAHDGTDLVVFPGQFLGRCTASDLERWTFLTVKKATAVLVTCDSRVLLLQNGMALINLSSTTPAQAIDLSLQAATRGPKRSIGTMVTAAGCVRVGVLIGSAAMNHAMAARSLMLAGAELLVNPVEDTAMLVERDDDVLLTRGFENAAAIVRVSANRSAVANWCNDMVPDGCVEGQKLLALAIGRIDSGVVHSSFNLSALRAQRANCIWGDAFRRPYQYQELCGYSQFPTGKDDRPVVPADTSSSTARAVNITVKVGILQLDPCHSNVECLSTAVTWLHKAKAVGVDVVVLPEMWSVGYSAQFKGYKRSNNATLIQRAYNWTRLATPRNGAYLTALRHEANTLDMAVAAPLMQEDTESQGVGGGPPRNSVALIDRFGDIAYVYSKVHTCVWGADEAMTAPGRHFFTGSIDVGGGRGNVTFGSMICADREFPESARLLAMHGAEILLVPNACGLVPAQLRQFRTRAVENVFAVAMANYASGDGNGHSIAFDHEGVQIVAGVEQKRCHENHTSKCCPGHAGSYCRLDANQLLVAEIDIIALRAARATPRGVELLRQPPAPQLCEIARAPEFVRENVLHRVGGSVY